MNGKFEIGKKYVETIDSDGCPLGMEWECVERTKCFATFHFHLGVNEQTFKAKIKNWDGEEVIMTTWNFIRASREVA